MLKRLNNILKGAASVLELCPDSRDRLKRIYPYASEADALRGDWERIGADLWKAVGRTDGGKRIVTWHTGGTLDGK